MWEIDKLLVCTREHQIQTYAVHACEEYAVHTEGVWGGGGVGDSTAMQQQQQQQRRESRARDGTETACIGTTPWARACRFPAHCLRTALQQGAREAILLTPGPLSKGLAGVAPASLVCPMGKDTSAGALA